MIKRRPDLVSVGRSPGTAAAALTGSRDEASSSLCATLAISTSLGSIPSGSRFEVGSERVAEDAAGVLPSTRI